MTPSDEEEAAGHEPARAVVQRRSGARIRRRRPMNPAQRPEQERRVRNPSGDPGLARRGTRPPAKIGAVVAIGRYEPTANDSE